MMSTTSSVVAFSCVRGFRGVTAAAALALAVACAPAPQTQNTPAAGSEMPHSIVDPYLKIQAALADDSTDGVKQNAGEIATAATALGAPAMKIDTAAVQLASAGDLADAREKFGALSEAVDVYMTGLKLKAPDGVRVAMCPMVNKPWLQEGSTIANPYYGKEMPTCGSFR
jgi:Cu(I)/Ag(I) efflux system membrane fusion protein